MYMCVLGLYICMYMRPVTVICYIFIEYINIHCMRPVFVEYMLIIVYLYNYIVYIQTIEQKMLQYHIVYIYIYTCFVKGATVTPVLLTC